MCVCVCVSVCVRVFETYRQNRYILEQTKSANRHSVYDPHSKAKKDYTRDSLSGIPVTGIPVYASLPVYTSVYISLPVTGIPVTRFQIW